MAQFTRMVEKLCELSRTGYVNPHERVDWPTSLDGGEWFTSPELISLYGTEVWANLTEDERKRLSFYEAVNFFSLNIHGEKSLIEGLAYRLYRKNTQDISAYLHHFLDEENKHMVYFGGFCMKYAGKIYADRKMTFEREYAPGEEDFLFFAKVLIFEEIVDAYNQRMAKDERLAPVIRQINLLHHLDETRHLAFGRRLVSELFKRYSPDWSEATVQGVRGYLGNYFVATWKEYYNPDVYRDAGLESPYDLYETAFHGPAGSHHRRTISQGCVRYLLENDILEEEPAL
jgi:hypothetical protein